MQKFPLEKILPIAFYLALIAAIGVTGYLGLSRRANTPAPAVVESQTAQATPIPLAVCEESTEQLCVRSTGYDADGNLLITIQTALQPMPPVYSLLRDGEMEIRFDCSLVNISPRLLYCLGPFGGDTASAQVELYQSENNLLLASGLLVPGSMAQTRRPTSPPAVTLAPTTPTGTPVSYPGPTPPAYPSYPYP